MRDKNPCSRLCEAISAFALVLRLLLHAPCAGAQTVAASNMVVVTKKTPLRISPSTRKPDLSPPKLGARLQLLDERPRNGFYHVRTLQGQKGWLPTTSVQVSKTLEVFPTEVDFVSRASNRQPCRPNLAACPATGCAPPGTDHAVANEIKRRVPSDSAAADFTAGLLLTFDDLRSLQDQATQLVDVNRELSEAERAKLIHLRVSNGEAAEGDLVRVVGFLVPQEKKVSLGPHPNK